MDKFIIIQNEDSELKNIYISEAGIKTLDKNLETKEFFLKSFESTSNGTLDSKDDLLFSNIVSISTFNDDFGIQIIYTKRNGKSETCYLEIENPTDQQEIKDFILSKTKLTPTDVQSKNKRSVFISVSSSILIAGLMVYSFKFMQFPNWVFIVYVVITIGLLFWVKMTRTRSALGEEKFVR